MAGKTYRRVPQSQIARQSEAGNILLALVVLPILLIGIGALVLVFTRNAPVALNSGATTGEESSTELPLSEDLPSPSEREFSSQISLNAEQARTIVEEWLAVKKLIFAPPFDQSVADRVVASGPLWTDLTKTNGSIEWLKKNNSYYSYSKITVDQVLSFTPSSDMPIITVQVTEDSTLHSPKGNDRSTATKNWVYTLKKESGRWKVWDYNKQP